MSSYLDTLIAEFLGAGQIQPRQSPASQQQMGGLGLGGVLSYPQMQQLSYAHGQQQTAPMPTPQGPGGGALLGAMKAYEETQTQRLPGIAGGLEGMWDLYQAPKKREAMQQEYDKYAQLQQNQAQNTAQQRADMVLQMTGDKQIATLAYQNPEIASKVVTEAIKEVDPSTMQKEWEYIQNIQDPQQKAMLTDRFMKQKETIMKMPLQFGYMYDENGEIKLTPGDDNPVRIEQQLQQQQLADAKWDATMAQVQLMDKTNNAINQVKRSLDMTGPTSTGFIGKIASNIGGTDAANLKSLLMTQQAGVAFETLRQMREASKTGGALGNVSNKEIELLYNSFAALSQDMSEDQLRRSLTDVLQNYEAMNYSLQNEQRFRAEGLTPQEMKKEIDGFINQRMVQEMGVPSAAWNALVENPEQIDAFEAKYGYRPRL